MLADRLEHPASGLALAVGAAAEKALVEQRLERLDPCSGDVFGCVEGAAAGEHRKRTVDALLLEVEELVRPVDRRSEGVLAGVGVAGAFEQVEALREAFEELGGRKERGTCRGELDCKWKLVEASAKLADRVVEWKVDTGGVGAVEEELLALGLRQGRKGPGGLGGDPEAFAAGDEEAQGRARVEQLTEVVGCFWQQVLGVVEQEKGLLAQERGGDGVGECLVGSFADLERACD
jgi:hypothetical protein